MKRTKMEKGITLVALIITIVILLILAAVAISSITNDGILNYAQNAANKINQAQKDEEGLLGYYQGYLEYGGGLTQEEYEDLEIMKRYALGANKTGRPLTEIINMETWAFLDDEETTDVNESTLYTFLNILVFKENKGVMYAKYNNKAYKIIIDEETAITENVKLVYSPQGREGTTVAYDSNGDGTDEEWVIITDRNGKVEIVSKNTMGELTLGYEDTSVNVTTDLDGDETIGDDGDKAIASYNKAITTINNYCKSLITSTTNVRSVGGTNNSAPAYHSTNYDEWSPVTIDVASGDTQYEEDIVKMSCWGIAASEEYYWIASRDVGEDSSSVAFCVACGGVEIFGIGSDIMWRLYSDDKLNPGVSSFGVRPVIINPSGI